MSRILYLNHYAGSPTLGMEFRPYYLGKQWIRYRHQVLVVAASYSHLRKQQPKMGSCLWRSWREGQISYLFFKTNTYLGNGVLRFVNILIYLMWVFVSSFYWAWVYRSDIVVASSTYPLDVLPALWIKKISFHPVRVIHEVHDLWPLTLTEIGGMSSQHPFVKLLDWAERFSYRHVDQVVSMLPTAHEHYFSRGLSADRLTIVPNGIDPQDWQNLDQQKLPESLQQFLFQLRQSGRCEFILGYAGYFGTANSLAPMIRAMAEVPECIHWVLVGSGPDRELLQNLSRQLQVSDRIHFFDPISKNQIPLFLEQMDVLYIGAPKSPLYRFGVSPNKLFDYFMAGKPILNAIEAGNDWVSDCQAGMSVFAEDVLALAQALVRLSQLPAHERELMGQRGQKFVQQFYYPLLAEKFLSFHSAKKSS